MTDHWFHTDEKEDIITSLEMLADSLNRVEDNSAMWKWAIIATHSTLQTAIGLHLRTSNNFLVAKQKDAEAWLRAHEEGTSYPEMMMDTFPNLYLKLKQNEIEGFKFKPRGSQGRSIKKINRFRNEFIHFMPKGWSIEISGMPRIRIDCLDVIAELDENTLCRKWESEEQRARFRTLLDLCQAKLNKLDLKYGT